MEDIDFLKEMKELTESLLRGKYDITKVQKLDKMIDDWISEINNSSTT